MIAIPLQLPNRLPKRPARPSGLTHVISEVFATSVKVAVYIPIAAIVATMLVAFVQRIFFPQCVAVVQEFEVSPEAARQLSMSGKSASNIVLDLLNQHAVLGSQFHGADYYLYDAKAGIQPIALEQSIKIPVQSSYGIEVKGVSIDTIVKVYNRIRNREWTISGDISLIGDQIVVRLRINRDGVAKYWEVPEPGQTEPGQSDGAALIRSATEKMLADEHPELLGRSFLQQHEYARAAEVFRIWTLNSPRDWRPSYYLSLAYDYQGQAQESLCMARWSRNVAEDQKVMSAMISRKRATSNTPVPYQLATVTEAVSQMNAIPSNDPPVSKAEAVQRLSQLDKVEVRLENLLDGSPSNSNYAIQLARSLDRKADLEMNSLGDLSKATDHEKRAIDLLDLAIREAPENGGLYEQRSVFLERLVALEVKQKMDPEEVARLKKKETDGFRQALELWPTNISPLWAAVYGLLDRNDHQGATDLAHAAMLLRPESTTANVAYTFALAHAGQADEAAKNLPHLLEAANQSELETLRRGFQIAGDSKSQSQIEEVWKRRFPQSSLNNEQRQAGAI
jgi:Flp pilus assembly protein TadD